MNSFIKKHLNLVGILNLTVFKKLKRNLWDKLIRTDYQRQVEGKENIILETEKMRKEKHRLWNKRKKKKKTK